MIRAARVLGSDGTATTRVRAGWGAPLAGGGGWLPEVVGGAQAAPSHTTSRGKRTNGLIEAASQDARAGPARSYANAAPTRARSRRRCSLRGGIGDRLHQKRT